MGVGAVLVKLRNGSGEGTLPKSILPGDGQVLSSLGFSLGNPNQS